MSASVFMQNQRALLLFPPPFEGNDAICNYTVYFRPAAASRSASFADAHAHNNISFAF